jgi:hypothetical protein
MLARTLRRLRAGWQAITDRLRPPANRFRSGWADPYRRHIATQRLVGAAVVEALAGALLAAGWHHATAWVAGTIGGLCAGMFVVGALIVLWGRDL